MEAKAIFLPGRVMGSSIAEELICNGKLSGNLHFHEHFKGQLKSYSLYGTLLFGYLLLCESLGLKKKKKQCLKDLVPLKFVCILKTSHQW